MEAKIFAGKQGSRSLTVRLPKTDIYQEDIARYIIIQNNGIIIDERGDYGASIAYDYPNLLIKARFNSTFDRDRAYTELKEVA